MTAHSEVTVAVFAGFVVACASLSFRDVLLQKLDRWLERRARRKAALR